jgi:hypothetical protein
VRNARKVFIAIAVIMALAFAGSAFAHCRWGEGRIGWGSVRSQDNGSWDDGYGGVGMHKPRGFDWPQELQDKRAEALKIMGDLRAELSKTPVNRERALALYRKHRAIRNEIGEWFFLQRLDRVSQ